MRRIFAQARKELTQIARDWRTLGLALGLPIVMLLLMSNSISFSVNDLPLVVRDYDDSPASREFVAAFRVSNTFHVVSWPEDAHNDQALISNAARAALIIPQHFGHDLARGETSDVQLLVDGSDANTAKLVSGYASRITAAYNLQLSGGAGNGPVQAAIRLW